MDEVCAYLANFTITKTAFLPYSHSCAVKWAEPPSNGWVEKGVGAFGSYVFGGAASRSHLRDAEGLCTSLLDDYAATFAGFTWPWPFFLGQQSAGSDGA